MNFESKYLVRWGIPGWIFIFWMLLYFLNADYNFISKHLNLSEAGKIIGVFISLGGFGIVIGYIIHQIYFLVNWVGSKNRVFDHTIEFVEDFPKNDSWGTNNWKDYFYFEFIWHKQLLSLDETTRQYITERYRYLLSTIHGLGTTIISHLLALFTTLILGLLKFGLIDLSWRLVFLNIIQLVIAIIILANFIYYSANLSHLQGHFMNAINKKQFLDNQEEDAK